MIDLFELLEEVKIDKNLAITCTKSGNHAGAVEILDNVVKKLKPHVPLVTDGLNPPTKLEKQVAAQLSDCYGSWGGALRRNKQYDKSVEAYDSGFKIESHERYGIVNSYNLVQRLVARILAFHSTLVSPESLEQLFVPEDSSVLRELGVAKQVVLNQLKGPRGGDLWGMADKATILLLLGEYEDASDAWDGFMASKPSDDLITSTKDMVTSLTHKFAEGEMKTALQAAITSLTPVR